MSEFTIKLDQLYRGPADLLLQLVKDEEVNVHDVQIAKVCQGFLDYLKELPGSDLEMVGDFMVIAANLMWVKSNALLPHEEIDLEEELQGKDDFLEKLLEYRRFREMARQLGEKAAQRTLRFERGGKDPAPESSEEEEELPFEDFSAWDLLQNYAKILKETLLDKAHAVRGGGRPVREYAKDIFAKIREKKTLQFRELFAAECKKEDVIGYFVALLEMVKQGIVGVDQGEGHGQIDLVLKNDDPGILTDSFATVS